MKRANLFVYLTCLFITSALADDWTSFDQPIGTPLEVYRQEAKIQQGTACELVVDDFRFDADWSASMDMIFSSTGDLSGSEPEEKSISLSLSRSVIEDVGAIVLHTYGFENDWYNSFRVGNEVSSKLELLFGWLSDDLVEYQIRDGSDEPYFGSVLVPDFNPKSLIVSVAGMEGRIRCRGVGVNL